MAEPDITDAPVTPLPAPSIPPAQLAAAAATAVVTAARVGRVLGRAGWRWGRQLPGGAQLEQAAVRIVRSAVDELARRLEPPGESASPEELRAVRLLAQSTPGEAPLRSAMGELLDRSITTDRDGSQQYLFGSIMSQLVPDEARILAALAKQPADEPFAAADVVIRRLGRTTRVVLAHASTVGRAAGVSSPESVPTYLTRLDGFGLLEFGVPDDETVARLATQYDILAVESDVRAALGTRRRSGRHLARATVMLSPLGHQFWAASNPATPADD